MWVKIDDQFPDHPKIRLVGALGLAIQTAAICYCGRYLTDGFLSYSAADALIRSVLSPFTKRDGTIWTPAITSGMSGEDADEIDWKQLMVEADLWENSRRGGYYVHDYLEYNPTKSAVLAQREAERKRKGIRAESGRNPGGIRVLPSPSPSPSEKQLLPPLSPPPESVTFQVPKSILDALRQAPKLGQVSRLHQPGYWQAQVRAFPEVDFARQLLQAEAWLTTGRGRSRAYKDLGAFLHNWLARAAKEEQ